MSVYLDPTTRLKFQQYLINNHKKPDAPPILLGSPIQLKNLVKISSSEAVSACFHNETPIVYPKLLKNQCLVACLDCWLDDQVYAIYNLAQMEKVEAQRNSGQILAIKWNVLEIPENLETELLKGIDLERGLIVTPPGDCKKLPVSPKEKRKIGPFIKRNSQVKIRKT